MVLRLSSLADLQGGSKPKASKYRNRRTVVDDRTFDSAKEARRYGELLLLERAGEIRDLQLQVPFVLAPSCRLHGAARATPALRYVADFVFVDVRTGSTVINDAKGMRTDVYQLKRHLMKTVLGLDIVEV